MKKILLCLIVLGFGVTSAHAESKIRLGLGWRQDHLNWSISGPDNHPNVLSELEWKNIQMLEVRGLWRMDLCTDWRVEIDGGYGHIYSGSNVDSDYAGDHHTELFSRSKNGADRGEAFDFSLGLGYPLCYWGPELVITPMIGYAQYEQHFQIVNGFQEVDTVTGFVGRFGGLHSSYQTRWMNAWLGFDFEYEPLCQWELYGSLQWHFSSYKARGHWNLRDDFLGDFKHDGSGQGALVELGVEYAIWHPLAVGIATRFQTMYLSHGTDKTKFLDPIFDEQGNEIGSEPVEGQTRLNSVHWYSIAVGATLSYVF